MPKPLSHIASFITGAVIFATLGVVYAWTGPTQTPPNGNVSAPVNVGTTDQIKNAGLGVNSLAVYGNAILSGASRYLNFGTTAGSAGYGIRDNAGVIEYKNSGGGWTNFTSVSESDPQVGTLTSGKWCTTNGTQVTCTSDQPLLSYTETDPQVSTLTASRYCKANSAGDGIVCSTTTCGDVPNGAVSAVSICTSGCTGSVNGVNVTRCVNGTLTSSGCPSGGRCSCFTKETLVTMEDGSQKPIYEIRVGDHVRAPHGGSNVVLALDHTMLWESKPQHLIRINGGEPFMTDNHPVMTAEGWKAANPSMAEVEAYDQLAGRVGQLDVGDVILLADGELVVETLEVIPNTQEAQKLYNLYVSGDHTYIANDMVVHGVVPDRAGLYTLEMEHGGE